jgi:TPR repeat protein
MPRMKHLTLALLLLALTPPALAGECRTLLNPLLLTLEPDPDRLAEVRALCAAEAGAGDADALYQLALFQLGLNGEWAPEEATVKVAAAATAGVPEAQYWMAWQRETGTLLAADVDEALRWYQLAADAEHRLALVRLAEAYAAGELGLPVDAREAEGYRARAAACVD